MMGHEDPNFSVGASDCPTGLTQAFIPNGPYMLYILAESVGMVDSPFGPAIEASNIKIEFQFSLS